MSPSLEACIEISMSLRTLSVLRRNAPYQKKKKNAVFILSKWTEMDLLYDLPSSRRASPYPLPSAPETGEADLSCSFEKLRTVHPSIGGDRAAGKAMFPQVIYTGVLSSQIVLGH